MLAHRGDGHLHPEGSPSEECAAFTDGYSAGYRAGLKRGRQLADEEAAAMHRRAAAVMRRAAATDESEVTASRRRTSVLEAAAMPATGARPWPEPGGHGPDRASPRIGEGSEMEGPGRGFDGAAVGLRPGGVAMTGMFGNDYRVPMPAMLELLGAAHDTGEST
jgi:hypothetical protein